MDVNEGFLFCFFKTLIKIILKGLGHTPPILYIFALMKGVEVESGQSVAETLDPWSLIGSPSHFHHKTTFYIFCSHTHTPTESSQLLLTLLRSNHNNFFY